MTVPALSAPFSYTAEGLLAFDGRSLEALGRQYGTPLFIGSRARLEANVDRFVRAFAGYAPGALLSYSTKTNSNVGLLQVLSQTSVYAGVCSGLDYRAARRAGFPPTRLIFDGLVKTPDDLATAVRERVALINAESWEELALINDLSRQQGCVTPVGLRARLGPAGGHALSVKHLLGIGYDRFGFDVRSGLLEQVLERARQLPHLRVEGLHIHEGSHYRSAAPYLHNFHGLWPVIQSWWRRAPGTLKYLNLGGGFGVPSVQPYQAWDLIRNTGRHLLGRPTTYDLAAHPIDWDRIGSTIATEVTTTFQRAGWPPPQLVFEPGRAIVGDAFVLLCRVLLRKEVPRSGTWLVLDAGTNLFPYLLSFNEYHQIVPVRRAAADQPEVVHLAGPLLYSSDIVMKHCALPRLAPGAMVAILDAGAYTLAYSNQFLYPRPTVVLLDRGQAVQVIREAETPDDVLRHDRVPSLEP